MLLSNTANGRCRKPAYSATIAEESTSLFHPLCMNFLFPRERRRRFNSIASLPHLYHTQSSLISVKPSAVVLFQTRKELHAMKIPSQRANCAVNHLAGRSSLIAPNYSSKSHSRLVKVVYLLNLRELRSEITFFYKRSESTEGRKAKKKQNSIWSVIVSQRTSWLCGGMPVSDKKPKTTRERDGRRDTNTRTIFFTVTALITTFSIWFILVWYFSDNCWSFLSCLFTQENIFFLYKHEGTGGKLSHKTIKSMQSWSTEK